MIPRNRTKDRLSALFVLGLVLFLPPVLLIFNRSGRVFGIPLLFLYVFCAWALIILLAWLATRGMSFEAPAEPQAQEDGRGEARDA